MLQLKFCFTFVHEMNNTRFATAIHILTLLASEPEVWMNSEWIAGSININPVVVRKELSILNDAGLVISKKGKEGGVKLGKSAKDIHFSEIFKVVNSTDLLGKKNQNTNPNCNIGRQINEKLDILFEKTDRLVLQDLEGQTLEDFALQFN